MTSDAARYEALGLLISFSCSCPFLPSSTKHCMPVIRDAGKMYKPAVSAVAKVTTARDIAVKRCLSTMTQKAASPAVKVVHGPVGSQGRDPVEPIGRWP